LETQFKASSVVFRPNILKLQQTMQTQPAKRDDDEQRFHDALNKYQLTVNNWLNKN
jgi:hypothetical protein